MYKIIDSIANLDLTKLCQPCKQNLDILNDDNIALEVKSTIKRNLDNHLKNTHGIGCYCVKE